MSASIVVEGLSKRYRLGGFELGYRTLRDLLTGGRRAQLTSELWALHDISFEVGQGEAVGLIGHNGAGKSTLLKILSRITEPTAGQALLYGRVASLLEIGTGFHPELTGRENIFLNGAILGMRRFEIRRDFDAIVAFADIERFLDTPVKRYSSGMYVRLAFAVAAHLTPEILLVDEVLSVGDAEFQRRCLGRMNEVARSGRTVIFVSHNLASIELLCPRSILLRGGRVASSGPTGTVIGEYLSQRGGESLWDLRAFEEREGSGRARITGLALLSADGSHRLDTLDFRQSFRLRIEYVAQESITGAACGFALLTGRNERLFLTETTDKAVTFDLDKGAGALECLVRSPNVLPGTYRLEVWISDVPGVQFADHVTMVGAVEIVPGVPEDINVGSLTVANRGVIYQDADWKLAQGSEERLPC
jgi:lipopolysaccharide transport system ATP-binding protein